MPGDTREFAFVPITNDMIVEGPECFNVVLTISGDSNATVGDPGEANVTIIDDGDSECLRVILYIRSRTYSYNWHVLCSSHADV